MAITPLDHVTLKHLGAFYISEEGTFGTAGTERRAWPVVDTVDLKPAQEMLDPKTLGPIPFDPETPVQGNKGGQAGFGYYLQPGPTLLDHNAGAVPSDADMPVKIPLRCLFGGESIPDVGSQVATGTSESQIDVTGGDGANFPAGQVFAVSTNNTVGLEVVQARSRSTDTLTLYPDLSATPATGREIVQFVNYYPTHANTRSISFAGTSRNTNRQYRFVGCTGTASLKFERGGFGQIDVQLEAATHSGPEALSLAVTRVEDSAAPPLAVRNSICWLQATSTDTRVDTEIDAVSMDINFGMSHLTSLTGTLEGKRGVFRSEGLTDAFARITVEMADNADVYTWFEAGTELTFAFILRSGTATARRHVVVFAPQCVIEARPERFDGDKNLSKVRIVLRAKRNEQCSGTLDNDELARAPFILALG